MMVENWRHFPAFCWMIYVILLCFLAQCFRHMNHMKKINIIYHFYYIRHRSENIKQILSTISPRLAGSLQYRNFFYVHYRVKYDLITWKNFIKIPTSKVNKRFVVKLKIQLSWFPDFFKIFEFPIPNDLRLAVFGMLPYVFFHIEQLCKISVKFTITVQFPQSSKSKSKDSILKYPL